MQVVAELIKHGFEQCRGIEARAIDQGYVGDKPLIERMMGEGFELTPPIWRKLNFAWIAFFLFSGACNIYVAYNYEEATWMNFKMFGMTAMSIVFVVVQMFWIMRVMPPRDDLEEDSTSEDSTGPTQADDLSGS